MKNPGYAQVTNQATAWADARLKERPFAWSAIQWLYNKAKGSTVVTTTGELAKHLQRVGGRTKNGTVPCRRTLCRFLDDAEAAGILGRNKKQNTKDGILRITLLKWVSKHVQQLRAAAEKKRVSQGGVTGVSQRETSPEGQGVSQGGVTPIKDDLLSEETKAIRAASLATAYALIGRKPPNTGSTAGLAC